ncbi:hypothetical protein J6U78_03640 [bacterium]|nr:hypothetical protein [bacterium]
MTREELKSLKDGEEVWITGYFGCSGSIDGLVKKATYSTDLEKCWRFKEEKTFFTKEEAVEAALNQLADKVRELEEDVKDLKRENIWREENEV